MSIHDLTSVTGLDSSAADQISAGAASTCEMLQIANLTLSQGYLARHPRRYKIRNTDMPPALDLQL